ncbi:MAG: hydroxyacylglutathione hydrolase [bacterium]|jgi:hydroxyacylglutathione hydrolase
MTTVTCIEMPTGYPIESSVRIYLVKSTQGTYLIDTSTHYQNHAELLLSKLEELNVTHLDWILLSHSHTDHSGNAYSVKKQFPSAKVLVHEAGVERLIIGNNWLEKYDPLRRELLAHYGTPRKDGEPTFSFTSAKNKEKPTLLPIQPDYIVQGHEQINDIQIIYTPGHSKDHLCFGIDGHFFGGDIVLSFMAGFESTWVGHYDSVQDLVATGKLLSEQSDSFHTVHTCHGKDVSSLKSWYEDMIVPRLNKKYQYLRNALSETEEKNAAQMMAEMHPKFPVEHYIYISQYMSLLELLFEKKFLSKTTTSENAWQYKVIQTLPENWMNEYCYQ